MMGSIETALQAARHAPFPGAWGLAQVSAAAVALGYVWFRTRRRWIVSSLLLALPAGVLGAFALGLLYRLLDRLRGEDTDLLGVAAYGAVAGVAVAFVALSRRRGLPALASLDLIAPALALLVAVGRLGCFLAGCDGGAVTASPVGVHFPAGSAIFRDHLEQGLVLATDRWSLAVHPAQLYEAGFALGLACLGHRLSVRHLAPGLSFAVIALGYALLRSSVDALRLPVASAFYGIFTSLVIVVIVGLLWRHRTENPRQKARSTRACPPRAVGAMPNAAAGGLGPLA
jgi:prolipoprotein diacylglyceryltransferase